MRNSVIVAALVLLIVPAGAQALRVGTDLIGEGDSKLEVLDVMGEPRLKERVENAQGGTIGWRYYYKHEGRQIIFHIRGGEVVRLEERDL